MTQEKLASAVGLEGDGLSLIREDIGIGFANAALSDGERYKEFPVISGQGSMNVADIEGPAVIRAIHVTRHRPKELFARGIVLEIWFDDAKEPAVRSPLADFFGDGCSGDSMYFSSKFVECAPWSYNCYFPMPFRKHARILLRNDTEKPVGCYCYVEWEKLPKLDERQGYFHATYLRKSFHLDTKTSVVFLDVKGSGHLLGRQLSIISSAPTFKNFAFIMEGDNEVDIDGRERVINYMGTEDSFTFSWGFRHLFSGQRAGMTLIDKGQPSRLSVYRFHDHMPIRFKRSLRWTITWQHELLDDPRWQIDPAWHTGGPVDYATAFYWYQSSPGGFDHAPLGPVGQR